MESTKDVNSSAQPALRPDPMSQLSEKYQKFVLAYAEHGNGARAAREAGYAEKNARREATRLLRNPLIKAALSAFMEEHGMSAGEAIGRLTLWARGSLEPFIRYREVYEHNMLTGMPLLDPDGKPIKRIEARLDLTTDEAKANIHLLKKIKQGQYGLEIELTDPKDAVDKLLQVHGRYKTKIDLSLMSEEELDILIEKFLNKMT